MQVRLEGNVALAYSGLYVEAARRVPGLVVRIGSKDGSIDLGGSGRHTPWGARAVFTPEGGGPGVVVDAHDASDIERGWDFELLEHCSTYFKVNIDEDVITDDRLRPYMHKILAIAPVYPIRPTRPLEAYSLLSRHRNFDFRKKRLADLYRVPTLRWMEGSAKRPTTQDFFFVTNFYQTAEYGQINDQRAELIEALLAKKSLTGIAGFASREPLPGAFEKYRLPWFATREYLTELAKARVGIYVRGIDDCLSFKLGQLLAFGKPLVGERITRQTDQPWHAELRHQYLGIDDPKGIVEAVAHVTEDSALSAELSERSNRVFREHFRTDAIARQMTPAFVALSRGGSSTL